MKRLPVRVLIVTSILLISSFIIGKGGIFSIATAQDVDRIIIGKQEPQLPSGIENHSLELNTLVGQDDFEFRQDLLNELSIRSLAFPIGSKFTIVHVEKDENWHFITIVSLDGPDSSLEHPGAGDSTISAIAYKNIFGGWKVAIAGTAKYSDLLAQVPENIVPSSIKPYLDPFSLENLDQTNTTHLFPWPSGSWEYRQGWHEKWSSNFDAVDVGTRGANADMRVLATAGGVITNLCSATGASDTWIRIANDDGKVFYYYHLQKDTLPSGIGVNKRVETGTVLGTLKKGTWTNAGCGFTSGQVSDSAHLHWVMPTDVSITVDGWTIQWPSSTWRKGGESRNPPCSGCGYQYLPSTNTPGGSPPPGEKVKLYRKPNFQEERFSFGTGFSNDPEGELYSMKVPSGWSVWTFREDNKGGQKRCWSGDVANFQDHEDWQSKIQSIDVKNYNDCPPPAPTANFDVWPPSGSAPLKVAFHDTSQGNYNSCLWEYGDGASSTTCGGSGSYHDHVYSSPGTYSPKLTVTGPGGSHSKTLENPIVVQAGTPPAPTLVSPANNSTFVEGASITLSWNSSANATGYYGAVLDGPVPIPFGWQTALEKNLGPLTPGYRYLWKVKARNDGGESDYSAIRTFDVVPAAPTNLVATAQSCTSVKLTWADNSSSENGYKIYRNGAEVGSVGAGSTNYTDGVQAKTTYNYIVKAYRNGFFSTAGSASVTTPDCPVPPPASPVLVSPPNGKTFVEGESIVLTWNSVANATGYFGSISGGPTPMTFGWQTTISKNIGAQWPGYEYLWEIKAKNGSTEGNYSNKWVFRVIPKAPSNLESILVSCSSVKLYWTDNSTSEDGYKIYRNGTEVGSVGSGKNNYTDEGLQGQTTYNYVVRAHRNGLDSEPSDTASITTFSCDDDTAPPQVTWVEPVGNEGTYEVSGETVTLKVNATDNVGVDFVVFWRWDAPTEQNIEIGTDSQAPYTASVDTSEFTNDWNEIRVQAIDGAGNASESPFIWLYYEPDDGSLDTPPLNAIDNSDGDGNYTVDWPEVSDATGYKLQERRNSGNWSQVYNGSNTSVNRSNRSDGEWCYRAKAYNNSVESDWSAVECTTVSAVANPPQVPTLYTIGNSGQQGSYWVSWSSVNGATTYELQEKYSSGTFKQIYSGPDTSQYKFGQSEGQWCYRARAKNGAGASNWSQTQCTMVVLNEGAYKSLIPLIID